jgi:cell division protein FtsB
VSLVDFLFAERTKLELAKELAQTAKENAALRNQVHALEHEIFWMKVAERDGKAA